MLCVNFVNNEDKPSESLLHDINCRKECCENKPRIDRSVAALQKCEELTSVKLMADKEDPLNEAFKLTNEIRKLRKKNREVKSELKEYSKKAKKFTVDLLNVCQNNDEVGVLFGYDHDDAKNGHRKKVKVLKEAIAARHKGVGIAYCFTVDKNRI